jgi:hypothetical protein
VELVRLKTAGTNALVFLIAFYIGKLWCQQPDSAFYIISKDTDYNALIKNLKTMGVADSTELRVKPLGVP